MRTITALSVFDLDNTLIKGTLSLRFFVFLLKRGEFSLKHLFHVLVLATKYKLGILKTKALMEEVTELFFGDTQASKLVAHFQAFSKKYSLKLCKPSVLKRLQDAHEEGHFVILATSSPQFLVDPFARLFTFDHVLSSTFDVTDEDLLFCKHLVDGEAKKACTMAFAEKFCVPKDRIFAYSDSISDKPLLEAVGNPIVVNPDRKLSRLARRHKWEVLQ